MAIMVTLSMGVLIFWATHAKRELDSHFLSAQLHRIHQVIDSGHGPHWRGIPRLDIPIFPHKEHREGLWTDLEVVSDVLHQCGREVLSFH